jgi:enoyl-CoA hydratase
LGSLPSSDWAHTLQLAEEVAAHPRATTNSDRRALLEGETLTIDEGLALEARLGRAQLTTAQEGARRFAQRK